jgi:hypothetical protein
MAKEAGAVRNCTSGTRSGFTLRAMASSVNRGATQVQLLTAQGRIALWMLG